MGICYATEFMPRGKANARDNYVNGAIARFDQADALPKMDLAKGFETAAMHLDDDPVTRMIADAEAAKLRLEANDLVLNRR